MAGHIVSEILFSLGIAHPNAGHNRRRVADKPDVSMVIDRSRLCRERLSTCTCPRTRSAINHAAHHIDHRQGDIFTSYLRALSLVLLQQAAVTVIYLTDEMGRHSNALIRKR